MTKLHKNPRKYFEGRNFMTPDVIRVAFYGDYAVEISEGTGFSNKPIFGVTVRNARTGEREDKLSKLCHSRSEAFDHAEFLGKQ